MELKTEEAKLICETCKKKLIKKYPDMIDCAFSHDGEYCTRLEDIDLLTEHLYKEHC